MYIKVHKREGNWFRSDGTLVGKDVFSIKEISCLKLKYNCRMFAKCNDKIHPIYEGYFDKKRNFIHFCNSYSDKCNFCSKATRNIFCKRELSSLKQKTGGYYINSSEPTKKKKRDR